MPKIFRNLAPLPAALTALGLAACGMAGAATIQQGAPAFASATTPAVARAAAPLDCRLILRESGGSVTVEGRLTATHSATGSYALRVIQRSAGGSSQIVQGGDFVAIPGQNVTLGQASFTGRAADLAAALTVQSGGRSLDCPARPG